MNALAKLSCVVISVADRIAESEQEDTGSSCYPLPERNAALALILHFIKHICNKFLSFEKEGIHLF
jgi:hypothetical protein